MSQDITMPRLSDTMEEGTISRWLKHEGDHIEKGEILVEIETDKANMEYPALTTGVLQRVVAQEGQTVKIGEVIAVLDETGAGQAQSGSPEAPSTPEDARKAEAPTGEQQAKAADQGLPAGEEAATAEQPAPAREEGAVTRSGGPRAGKEGPRPSGEVTSGAATEQGRLMVTPIARRIAQERGIDLRGVKGSGPGGRIIREDVESYQPSAPAPTTPRGQPPAPAAGASAGEGVTRQPMSRMQQVIARRMVDAKAKVPHFYVSNEVDMDDALELRQRLNAGQEKEQQVRLEALIIRACALALRKFPVVNASFREDEAAPSYEVHDYVNIAHAVALPEGLVVPIVRDCDKKGIRQIDQDMRANIERARANKLAPADLERSTFSVSNLGMFDVDEFTPVVNPPNAAILAIPSVRAVPAVVDGQVTVRQRLKFTLSCDHRILYGAVGAQFLQELKRLLQAPYSLLT